MINTSDEADDVAGRLPCLREFAAAGQDKAAVARLYNALVEDLQPANLVERILIRDIAVLTIRSEELRMVQLAVHKVVMGRTAAAAGLCRVVTSPVRPRSGRARPVLSTRPRRRPSNWA